MSSSAAGKFQDHYHVLGVDPKSDWEAIQNAYTKLAHKYHPGNPETGDAEKFESLNMAYEILADPVLRREFDKLKGGGDGGPPKFSGNSFFNAVGRDAGLRSALLCVLYDRRRMKPFTPSLSMRHLESIIDCTTEELNFALWYLKQRNFAASDDKSSLLITVEGMDYLEKIGATPEVVLPLIRAQALAGAAPAPAEIPAPAPVEEEPPVRPRVGTRVIGMLKNNNVAKAI
jgi:curved DNA-binding protein CbpA